MRARVRAGHAEGWGQGQRGLWDTAIVGDIRPARRHFQEAAGLTSEILYTQGAGETQRAVISGSVEVGVGAGSWAF